MNYFEIKSVAWSLCGTLCGAAYTISAPAQHYATVNKYAGNTLLKLIIHKAL